MEAAAIGRAARRSAQRARRLQVQRLIADGTGRSPEEIPLLAVSIAASAVVAGALAATLLVLRFIDYVQEA